MNKKSISINPVFFKIKDTRKKEKRVKPKFNTTLKPNNIKKALMEKIKNHQHKKKGGNYKNDFKNQLKFEQDFSNSLEYLEKISEKKTPSSPSNIKPDPAYGILKGGKKPLYSEYKKTLKKKAEPKNKPDHEDWLPRKKKLEELKKKMRHEDPSTNKKNKTTFRKLIRRKLGKINEKIHILIKNIKSRKKIKKKCKEIKQKKISTIKSKLRKRGLLKIGSFAPENIIREIYNASELTGDVYNKNGEVLLHNYMNEQDLKAS